jgi:hypothetical protein
VALGVVRALELHRAGARATAGRKALRRTPVAARFTGLVARDGGRQRELANADAQRPPKLPAQPPRRRQSRAALAGALRANPLLALARRLAGGPADDTPRAKAGLEAGAGGIRSSTALANGIGAPGFGGARGRRRWRPMIASLKRPQLTNYG